MKRAVLDLGTNTFHLLIAEQENRDWKLIFKERIFVFLGEYGLDHISSTIQKRAAEALLKFKAKLDQFQVDRISVVTTAGMRKAQNSKNILEDWEEILDAPIQVISGEEEANFIAKGVQCSLNNDIRNGLILDIGGGSIETILLKNAIIDQVTSVPFGLSVLHEKFHKVDPLSKKRRDELLNFLTTKLFPETLKKQIKSLPNFHLIGAAGSFEIFRDENCDPTKASPLDRKLLYIRWENISLIGTNERLQEKWIDEHRVKYMVESLAIMLSLARAFPEAPYMISPYALKEGILNS